MKFLHLWFGKLFATIGIVATIIGLLITFGLLETQTLLSVGILGLALFLSVSANVASALQGIEYRVTRTTSLCTSDSQLLRQLSLDLPPGETTEFLRSHNFGSAFRYEDLQQLREFRNTWDNNAENEFVDSELEKKRRELLSTLNKFLALLAVNSGTENDIVKRSEYQKHAEPVEYHNVTSQLNEYATQIYDAHQQIVRVGKKRLPD